MRPGRPVPCVVLASSGCRKTAVSARYRRQIGFEGPMNTQLIADAVRNSKGQDESTVWDRLFAFWFQRLVYTQIWEDPEGDLAALPLPVGSTLVTISSSRIHGACL